MTAKPECSHLEVALDTKKNAIAPVGTVTLVDHNELILIPTPSPDPRDPLNLPQWRKWLILITLGLFSITSVLLTSGMGPIFAEVKASYNNDPKSSDLMTYPTLFMGIGNLISMPLAMAVGRRPIFLCSAVILVIGSIWCASSSSLGSHIAGRDILSLAAGQSEALCPLIIQEVHFLHERSRKLAYFSAIQSIGTAALIISTTYLTNAAGWRWWYGIFGIVNFFILILAVLFVPESRYTRPTDAFEGEVHISRNAQHSEGVLRVTTHHGVELDLVRYQPRNIKYDLKIYHGPANWNAATECLKHMSQCILFPNILWIILMNSCVLGIYVVMVTEFSTILSSPPYNVPFTSLGFVQGGQIVVSMIMVPVLGYGSDFLTRFLARRNGGVSEPEYRIILIILPAVVVVISCVFFGLAGEHPTKWSQWAVIISYNAEYFGFIGIVLIGFTYTLDSYPERAGPALVLICAVRGLVSFGIGFGVTNFIKGQGYERAISVICATVMGALSLMIFPICWWGKKIRKATAKYAMDHIVAE